MSEIERGYPGDVVEEVLKSLAGLVPVGEMVRFEMESTDLVSVSKEKIVEYGCVPTPIGPKKISFSARQIYGEDTESQ